MADTKSSETPIANGAGKPVVIEKSLAGLDGWLAFWLVALGANIIGWLWAFFIAIAGLTSGPEGTGLAVLIETLIFALGLVALSGLALLAVANRKKIGVAFSYITLGAAALYTTVVSITTMFSSYESCAYGSGSSYYSSFSRSCESVGLPASMIIALIGAIFAAWAGALLMALYFKKSQRVKSTLTK
jgi:hypothetical protein